MEHDALNPIIFSTTKDQLIDNMLQTEYKHLVIDNTAVKDIHQKLFRKFLNIAFDRVWITFSDTSDNKKYSRKRVNVYTIGTHSSTLLFVSPTIENCAMHMVNDAIDKYSDADNIIDRHYSKFIRMIEIGIKRCGGKGLSRLDSLEEEIAKNQHNRKQETTYFDRHISNDIVRRRLEQEK
jgi:hypothetical protein